MIYECYKGVTSPKGFYASGIYCGIRKKKKDIALVYSECQANAAAVFTTSKVQAAPVTVNKLQLKNLSSCRAIIVNSGNANACTGERGMDDAWNMIKTTAKVLEIDEKEVLVSSTGVIGQYMPMDKIIAGITEAASLLSEDGNVSAAQAIMTTDTFKKEFAVKINLGGIDIIIGGMAKGSGMIAPNMATMLAFITTDAKISRDVLQYSLNRAADRSFNRISVDGDTSTNDMVILLANGMAGNNEILDSEGPEFQKFYEALEYVLVKLSKMIVVDGEGATKFIEIEVKGALSEDVALIAARSISKSNLVKTAIHGEDANWGRILAAVGYSGIDFNPADVEISLGSIPILRRNFVIDFSEDEAKKVLIQREIKIIVDLNQGDSVAWFWTCDLSKEYISINANYRT